MSIEHQLVYHTPRLADYCFCSALSTKKEYGTNVLELLTSITVWLVCLPVADHDSGAIVRCLLWFSLDGTQRNPFKDLVDLGLRSQRYYGYERHRR